MSDPSTTGTPTTTTLPAATQPFPCCPPDTDDPACDVLDFFYRLNHTAAVQVPERTANIPVEVKLHFRLTRCPGPLAIGDLVYTTTVLPGEKVRLFTSDRRTRFTFDSSTDLAYRNTQSSEDTFYMQSMSDNLFDVSSRDEANSSNKSHAHVDGHGDAGINILGLGGSASMSGNFDANSTATFLGEHHQHAQDSHHSAELGTRKAASVSVGDVATRTHTSSQSEDHFESSSREFSNPNKCHALTFLFYQINKTQKVTYTLESIERRVILDPANDFTKVARNPLGESTAVGVTSNNVLSTNDKRPAAATTAVEGTLAEPKSGVFATTAGFGLAFTRFAAAPAAVQTVPVNMRQQALDLVDRDLVEAGLLDKVGGVVSPDAQKRFSFEVDSSLPTAGLLVKSCLDNCNICEDTLVQEIGLDLARRQLENDLLKKQIDLLDKSQEYRCCPAEPDKPKQG